MPTAVVILPSSTYRAKDFLDAAEALGIDLVVASEQPPPLSMGDRYVEIDCSDPEKAAEAIANLGDIVAIDGVVAADDQGVMVAAHANTLLGLRGNPVDAAAATPFDRLRQDRKVKKIGRADVLIAAIVLAHRATLVTRNLKDFRQVPGLPVENWADA